MSRTNPEAPVDENTAGLSARAMNSIRQIA
jgi:hypothetical protein